jgi:hypothetical protein
VKGQKNVFVFAKIALPKMPAVKNIKICQLGSLFFKIVKFASDLFTEILENNFDENPSIQELNGKKPVSRNGSLVCCARFPNIDGNASLTVNLLSKHNSYINLSWLISNQLHMYADCAKSRE